VKPCNKDSDSSELNMIMFRELWTCAEFLLPGYSR